MSDTAFSFPPIRDMSNESDVEQKLIYPFVTTIFPFGLGYPLSSVLTKKTVRGCEIGKGSSRKSYFPDYVLTAGTLPRVVIEAKAPSENLNEAYREARLYAAEINAQYPSGQNPLTYVVACNGQQLHFGSWDQATPTICAELENNGIASGQISAIIESIRFDKLTKDSDRIKALIKPKYFKPRRMIGGQGIQNEEVGLNSFGARIQGELLHIFNPTTTEDRAMIVKNAYIGSRRRERFVEPIDRVIRAASPPSHTDSQLLEDTANPKEITRRLVQLKPLENKILLLIGMVGAGKTTFLDYLQIVALPREVTERTVWVRINMNTAPVSPNEIYSWLRREIRNQCQASQPSLDFEDLDQLQKLYSVELKRFKKGPGKLFEADPITYSVKLAEEIQKLQADEKVTALAFTRFCVAERGKLLIIALDNSDKRTLDEQLLMFEAAQWLQKEYRCLIMLPLREETYDNYRDRPPLDTALKDLVFRIEPPLFQNVLHKRIQLALKHLALEGNRQLTYELPNGFRVEYGSNEISYYLTSIVKSIFEHDKYIRRLITGLAGRNIRRALEIFIEFCTSGHITEDQILKIKRAEGAHSIPLEVVTRVLLRTNRRLYDSDHSYVLNVFGANWNDEDPNHFVRKIILTWLLKNISEAGPSGQKGYFPISEIKRMAVPFGIVEEVLTREITYLLIGHCIVSETYKTENLDDCELIRLASAGMVHLDLLTNIDYLAAIAEDTYFDNEATARKIADTLRKSDRQLKRKDVLYNASILVEFLLRERERRNNLVGIISANIGFESLTDLTDSERALKESRELVLGPQWEKVGSKYQVGSSHKGIIVNPHVSHGLFVELEAGITGLIPKRSLQNTMFATDYRFLTELAVEVVILVNEPLKCTLILKLIRFMD
ncbi:Type I restriction enzyme R protein N terminus (HSDR_N) [Nitrosospira briensis]|uniref:Type I restriction enzyme R protein N terminus (HSDR_N) n=1 Tax=Nitrosospira briensis TaxID=35799 RepID=A0A1I4Z435_9PROT|nr:type I restriction endonuclease [Nitrosospira briensis]SFN45012.1 Type I restriction enzyme R protein N terminus (HSDR_N) [Nitrosospira briensis]